MARTNTATPPHYEEDDGHTQDSAEGSDERGATIIRWAQRLMLTRGFGWSKAVDHARELYGDEE